MSPCVQGIHTFFCPGESFFLFLPPQEERLSGVLSKMSHCCQGMKWFFDSSLLAKSVCITKPELLGTLGEPSKR